MTVLVPGSKRSKIFLEKYDHVVRHDSPNLFPVTDLCVRALLGIGAPHRVNGGVWVRGGGVRRDGPRVGRAGHFESSASGIAWREETLCFIQGFTDFENFF